MKNKKCERLAVSNLQEVQLHTFLRFCIAEKTSSLFFKNALKSAAKSCDAWHLYNLVDRDGSYYNMLLLRMLENSFSLSRIHSLVFI